MIQEPLRASLADRYRLERELGQGGMATVYLAEDLKHRRQVAIKVLKPELAAVLGAERFVQEITTTAQLQHPHILPLFDSGSVDGFLYYVMPYIQGETLRAKLDREHQLGVEEAVKITTEVADALDYAHRHGVIHRDIKPENILLHDGRPMVADFGIALAVSAAAGGRMTETGLSLGTPHYMSPEQATAEKDITARSDIYSLASVLYEMLTGQPPHLGGSAQQVIMKIIAEPVPAVTSLRKSVPANVAAALGKALEKLPADRFESARGFAEALADRNFSTGTGALAGSVTVTRDRQRLATAVTLAVVATGAAIFGWTRGTSSPVRPLAYDINLTPSDTALGFLQTSVTVGPRGDAIVFADTVGGIQQLWIKERESTEPRVIPGTIGAAAPFLSPDGMQLDYQLNRRVMSIPLVGGSARTISDSVTGLLAFPGAWLDDGSIVLPTGNLVYRLPPGGGAPQRIATADSLSIYIYQVSSVPGKRAALMAGCERVACGRGQVYLVRFDPLEIVPLVQGASAAWALDDGRIVYVQADGSIFVASLDADRGTVGQPRQLSGTAVIGHGAALRMSRDGVILRLTGGSGPPSSRVNLALAGRGHPPVPMDAAWSGPLASNSVIDVSPDGKQVLLTLSGAGSTNNVFIKSLPSGGTTQVTTDGANNIRATWSPDGKRIVWISDRRGGHFEVWWRAADGSDAPELLMSEARDIYDATLAPDGEWLIWRTDNVAAGNGDIYARHLHGDTTVYPIATSAREETSPEVSPDGNWIVFSEMIGDTKEVVVRSFPDVSRSRTQVSTGGGTEPRWTPDGKALVYRKPEQGTFVFARVAADGAFRVLADSLVTGLRREQRYLDNDNEHLWDLMPDGRDLLLARLLPPEQASAVRLRLILQEGAIPAPGAKP